MNNMEHPKKPSAFTRAKRFVQGGIKSLEYARHTIDDVGLAADEGLSSVFGGVYHSVGRFVHKMDAEIHAKKFAKLQEDPRKADAARATIREKKGAVAAAESAVAKADVLEAEADKQAGEEITSRVQKINLLLSENPLVQEHERGITTRLHRATEGIGTLPDPTMEVAIGTPEREDNETGDETPQVMRPFANLTNDQLIEFADSVEARLSSLIEATIKQYKSDEEGVPVSTRKGLGWKTEWHNKRPKTEDEIAALEDLKAIRTEIRELVVLLHSTGQGRDRKPELRKIKQAKSAVEKSRENPNLPENQVLKFMHFVEERERIHASIHALRLARLTTKRRLRETKVAMQELFEGRDPRAAEEALEKEGAANVEKKLEYFLRIAKDLEDAGSIQKNLRPGGAMPHGGLRPTLHDIEQTLESETLHKSVRILADGLIRDYFYRRIPDSSRVKRENVVEARYKAAPAEFIERLRDVARSYKKAKAA